MWSASSNDGERLGAAGRGSPPRQQQHQHQHNHPPSPSDPMESGALPPYDPSAAALRAHVGRGRRQSSGSGRRAGGGPSSGGGGGGGGSLRRAASRSQRQAAAAAAAAAAASSAPLDALPPSTGPSLRRAGSSGACGSGVFNPLMQSPGGGGGGGGGAHYGGSSGGPGTSPPNHYYGATTTGTSGSSPASSHYGGGAGGGGGMWGWGASPNGGGSSSSGGGGGGGGGYLPPYNPGPRATRTAGARLRRAVPVLLPMLAASLLSSLLTYHFVYSGRGPTGAVLGGGGVGGDGGGINGGVNSGGPGQVLLMRDRVGGAGGGAALQHLLAEQAAMGAGGGGGAAGAGGDAAAAAAAAAEAVAAHPLDVALLQQRGATRTTAGGGGQQGGAASTPAAAQRAAPTPAPTPPRKVATATHPLQQPPSQQLPRRPRPEDVPSLDELTRRHEAIAAKMVALQSAYAFPAPRNLSVAVVNHAPYHLEVVAGLLHALKAVPRVRRVAWYQSGQGEGSGMPRAVGEHLPAREIVKRSGFDELVGEELASVEFFDAWHDKPKTHDFAIFVSPEYFVEGTRTWVDASRPSAVMMLFHNGDNPAVQQLAPLHPRLHFVALSPHVAGCATAAQRLTPTPGWMLPVRPFGRVAELEAAEIAAKAAAEVAAAEAAGKDKGGGAAAVGVAAKPPAGKAASSSSPPAHPPCNWDDDDHPVASASSLFPSCLDGFALQGNFEPMRRNYTRLWAGMVREEQQARVAKRDGGASSPASSSRLHLLGRGAIEALAIPKDLTQQGLVVPHTALPYDDYYNVIARSQALLLSLGSASYLRCKASSSMGASLATGTPLVADASVLAAYRYLAPKHVFALEKGEDEAAAMRRVAALPASEHRARRKALTELTLELNRAAAQMLHNVIPTAEESPHPAGSVEGAAEFRRRVAAMAANGNGGAAAAAKKKGR